MNPKLAGVFPQFDPGEKLQNVYSFAQTEKRVRDYLVVALNGKITAEGEIAVKGKQSAVLSRVRALQAVIESFINDMPKVVQALRKNTPLYLPYATLKQLEETKTSAAKIKAMRAVMDNFQYNSDMGALNSVKNEKPEQFAKNKKAWEKKVGYRRLKRV
ncbi:MAG: hypothetical protein K2L54_05625 [Clostridiales bacterium]|nr:hypothetical protein [Clostridiales bacterium]